MEVPCYRCGSPVEEGIPFCPSCNAPQIRVTAPASSQPDEPSTPPLPPGTPSSIEPPGVPLRFEQMAPINWRQFLRSALPLCLLAGVGLVYAGLLGVIIFFGMVAITVVLYRRHHPMPLSARQGARMGGLAGLLGFAVSVIIAVASAMANPGDAHQQMAAAIHQKMASNPDPHAQQFAQWAASTQGLIVLSVIGTIFFLVLCVILSSAVGALAATLSSQKDRR